MGAFSRAFSAARDGVNARRAEGRRPSNDARFDKKTENSIDKHRDLGLSSQSPLPEGRGLKKPD